MQRAPRLEIRLLGHVEVRVDGAPFALATPRKSLEILTFLLLNRTASVARDFLAFSMWPDDEEEVGRQRLRATLHDLQRVLPASPEPWIVVSTESLAWNSKLEVWFDVDAFEAAANDPARLVEAAALYRGDLATSIYDEWIVGPRERLQQSYLRVLGDLLRDARRRHAYGEALDWARKLLEVDPWREDVVRRAMSVRFESGDRAGALAEYRRFADRLRNEMGVEAMPETQALMESIARGTDGLEPEDRAAMPVARAAPQAALPFVGRDAELARALAYWERAAHGDGQVVGIGGEAGIGKSRLAHELFEAIEERGGRAMRGACGSPEAGAYEPFADALRGALPLLVALPLPARTAAVLATLIPELGSRIRNLPELVPLDPERERERLFDALAATLALIARPRPLVLVIEDLHWAGTATLEAVAFLAQRLRSTRSLLVLTYREDETPRNHPVRRLLRERGDEGAAIVLGPLGVGPVQDLMRACLDDESAIAPALVHERAGGNPLFLAQLLVDAEALRDGALPESLGSLIESRFEALSPEAATVAEVAAAIGERFSLDVVRDVLGWSDAETFRALDALIDRRIVRERGGRGLFPYAFAHQLVQRIVAERSPIERRVARHRRIARVLDEMFPDRADELAGGIARHYDRGGEPERAVERYVAAARHAMTLGAIEEARALLGRALELAHGPRARADVLLAREEIGTRVDTVEQQLTALHELADTVTACGDDALRCEVLVRMARALFRASDDAGMYDVLVELREEAGRQGAVRWLALADYLESLRLELNGTAEAAIAMARRAREQFGAAGDVGWAATAAVQVACICAESGRINEGRLALDDALALAERAESYDHRGQALFAATVVALARGDFLEMRAAAERWIALAAGAGDRRTVMRAKGQLGSAQLLLRSLGSAKRTFEEVDAAAAEFGLPLIRAAYLTNQGALLATIGDLGAAADCFSTARTIALKRNSKRLLFTVMSESCLVSSLAGDAERAIQDGRAAIEGADRSGYKETLSTALEHVAEAELLAGRRAEALASVRRAVGLRLESGSASRLGSARALEAEIARGGGDLASALAAVSALDVDKEETFAGAPFPERVGWFIACVCRAAGCDREAQRWLRRALELQRDMRASLNDAALEAAFDGLPWRALILAESGRILPDGPGASLGP